jgi:CDP-glycerol glycerophosphotransferase (TagB/SpsB family)
MLGLDPSKKIVLYAPTFNVDLSSVYTFANRFAELHRTDCSILIKLHGSTVPKFVNHYRQCAEHHTNFFFIDDPNLAPYIGGADIMISDVSSAFMEFMALDKPVILFDNPNRKMYHGYNEENIEYKWRDLAQRADSFDGVKELLESVIQRGDDKSEIRRQYSARLFTARDGSASKRVWEETRKICAQPPRTPLPTFSVVLAITPDNLFIVRKCIYRLQFYSVMPIELVLAVQDTSGDTQRFIEQTETFGHFSSLTRIDCDPGESVDSARFRGVQAATGDYIMVIDDTVEIFKNFDYILFTTFRTNSSLAALTGVANISSGVLDYRQYAPDNTETQDYDALSYRFINRYRGTETAEAALDTLPKIWVMKRELFHHSPLSDWQSMQDRLLSSGTLNLSLSCLYYIAGDPSLQRVRELWKSRDSDRQREVRVKVFSQFLKNNYYPDIAQRLCEDLSAMGIPCVELRQLVKSSTFMRFYDSPCKQSIVDRFPELTDEVEGFRRDIAIVQRLNGEGREEKSRQVPTDERTESVPDTIPPAVAALAEESEEKDGENGSSPRVMFYFFKNVHIPVLLPIYETLKQMHPGLAIGFGYMHYAPEIRAGFTPDELDILTSFGERLYAVPGEFKPDITFIADSVYPWTQNCGKLVHVGHGVLSKGQYYTDTAIARREEQADLICVPGAYHEEVMKKIITRPVVTTGMAKLDAAFGGRIDRERVIEEYRLPRFERYILFAPTFNDELSAIPFVKDKIREVIPDERTGLIIKLHGSTPRLYVQNYRRVAQADPRVALVETLDITPFLVLCDMIISDVSSVMMEGAALDKPLVLFNNPDWKKYKNYTPDDIEFRWRDIGIQVGSLAEMKEAVRRTLANPGEFAEKRKTYTDRLFANKYDAGACERIIRCALGEPPVVTPAEDSTAGSVAGIEEVKKRLESAVASFDSGEYEQAVTHFDSVLQLDPSMTDILHARAMALFQVQRYEESLDSVRRYLDQHPDHEYARVLEGKILNKMEKV